MKIRPYLQWVKPEVQLSSRQLNTYGLKRDIWKLFFLINKTKGIFYNILGTLSQP